MPKLTALPSSHSRRTAADNAFDRDVAELKAAFDRIEALLRPLVRQEARRAKMPPPAPAGMAAASAPAAATDSMATRPAAAAQLPAPASPLPSGNDLADPRNFGMLPPLSELERGDAPPEDYQRRLTRHLTFATQVLHTSGVAAAVWREWRAFEKTLQERLRQLNQTPP